MNDDIDQTHVQQEVTQLMCIYIGTTQQSPAQVFANLHPPASAILKSASDPFSDSSTNYILHRADTIYIDTDVPEGRTQVLKIEVGSRE